MKKPQPVRGTHDLPPADMRAHARVTETAWIEAARYGYQPISTPIFEFTEVFTRTLGETSDVVTKEMYTFTDKGGDSLTLRPEGTAGIARAFISGGVQQDLPLRFFCAGPMAIHPADACHGSLPPSPRGTRRRGRRRRPGARYQRNWRTLIDGMRTWFRDIPGGRPAGANHRHVPHAGRPPLRFRAILPADRGAGISDLSGQAGRDAELPHRLHRPDRRDRHARRAVGDSLTDMGVVSGTPAAPSPV